jgi:hypothetical protein
MSAGKSAIIGRGGHIAKTEITMIDSRHTPYVIFRKEEGSFALAENGAAATLCAGSLEFPGVLRALTDLSADIEKVAGTKPGLSTDGRAAGRELVLVGTLGRHPLIDGLVREKRIDASKVVGRWEAFLIAVVEKPFPGTDRALVIAGSDKRGTIFGIYELSALIGVSPWYWWADSKPEKQAAIHVLPGQRDYPGPSVKYRGIFLNDEYPALTKWVAAKYGMAKTSAAPPVPEDVSNYGHEFYQRLFELILRLKGNFLWPAMWNNAFNEDDPLNPKLADEYGIVMGTSHQEPMIRAQKEWDRRYKATLGYWNYRRDSEILHEFWKEGIERNKDYESVVTIGLRGADDTALAEGGPEDSKAMLEKIVGVQRSIIAAGTGKSADAVPQAWCLYKEAQDYYDIGLRVPDDVTLLWAEDNWGNVRRLPTPQERRRSGGAGIYYHFDYHGGPRSYQWINTSPIAKIYDQMSLSKQYGADRIWVVNVGHFKGYELPLEFFMDLAWDTEAFNGENLQAWHEAWAAKEFGPERAADIAWILDGYTRINGRRKPELLSPGTYSLVDYLESETLAADYAALAKKAEEIHAWMPPSKKDAFYGLVLFPAKACALVNELYHYAGKNALYHAQGRAATNDMKKKVESLFAQDLALMDFYNREFAQGKWAHFMDQAHLGYVAWNDPPENSLNALTLYELETPRAACMGVAVEGSADGKGKSLPGFDSIRRQRHYLEIFNKGREAFDFSVERKPEWVRLSESGGKIEKERRIWVDIDWEKAASGVSRGEIELRGAGEAMTIAIEARKSAEVERNNLKGFAESEGVVSMEAEHFTGKTDFGRSRWTRIEGYGHTLSGMRAETDVDLDGLTPGRDAPWLEYRMYLFGSGDIQTLAYFSPSLNYLPQRGVRYAVSIDDGAPLTVTLVPEGYKAQNGNGEWEKSVIDGYRIGRARITTTAPGYHTLKIWMIDPGIVLTKLVVDLGGLKPSFLGPPESYRAV